MTRPPFPEVLDSTIIAAVRSCGRKAQLEFIEHYKPRDQSVHLHAGAAYASGLEAARRSFFEAGDDPDTAKAKGLQALLQHYGDFACPDDSPKSASRMAGALEFYLDRYPLDADNAVPLILPDGKRAIEFGFVEPLEVKHPETGNPILYCGRMDMAVNFDGLKLGLDDKTTSQLGASWPKQWDLRSQFTGYTWGAEKAGIKLDGFLVRGVSILKTRYDTLQTITYRPSWHIERWYYQLIRDIKHLIAQWKEGYFDYNLDHACTEYGGCIFRQVCLAKSPQPYLDQMFERRAWNPITRTETLL